MKYFLEYENINSNFIQGILNISNDGYKEGIVSDQNSNKYIIDNIYDLNRSFDNETVFIRKKLNSDNYQIISKIKNDSKPIPGVLCVHSKVLYGTNKKNVPIYLFKPNDHKLPNFYVPSNIKKTRKNMYVNIYCTI